jgi:hypothetical protein
VVRFPRTVATPAPISRDPERAWSLTRQGADAWQRSAARSRPPRIVTLAIVTGDGLKRIVALVVDPAASVTTTRR